MQSKSFSSRLDRRITLEKPDDSRTNDYNEAQTIWILVFSNLPAGEVKSLGGKEGLEMNSALRAELTTEWEIRYFGNTIPQANWRFTDEMGRVFDIVSQPEMIGRREGWTLTGKQVQ